MYEIRQKTSKNENNPCVLVTMLNRLLKIWLSVEFTCCEQQNGAHRICLT